jgi:hypothetical protein
MRLASGIVAIVSLVAMTTPRAHSDDKDVIEYREHIMNTLNEQSAIIGLMLSTSIPDDTAIAHLDTIALTASTALAAFEPKVPGGQA